MGPRSLYVSKPTELGVTVLGVKYGKVDLDNISLIGMGAMTTPNRVAIIHPHEGGDAGSARPARHEGGRG